MLRKLTTLSALGVITLSGAAHAAFVLQDDFTRTNNDEGVFLVLQGSTASNGNVWTASGNSFRTTELASGEQVLRTVVQNNQGAELNFDASLPTDAQGTMFFQIQAVSQGTRSFTVSASENTRSGATSTADKTTSQAFGNLNAFSDTGTWYNVWVDVDTNVNRYFTYLQEDGAAGPRTLLNPGGSDFRDDYTDGNPIQAFFIRNNAGNTAGEFYIDNIYFDANGFNASNPIPEPGSLALLGLGAFLFSCRPRNPDSAAS